MENSVHEPFFCLPSQNGSTSNNSTNFTTLFESSHVVGFNKSHLSFDNINSSNNFLEPIVLIVPPGIDIVNAIINFSHDQDVDISVHHASGLICEINLCNPLSTSDDLCFLGTFHMISLTGFYTNNNLSASSPPNNIPYPSFAIQFTRGSPPKLFGGRIGGKLIGVEPVHVMASIVKKHEYHKPNVQPVIKSTRGANHYVDITNNTDNNHLGFSNIGPSSSSPINIQTTTTPYAPTDANMHALSEQPHQ